MKKRVANSWIPGPVYSAQLSGPTVNLLVREMEPAVSFARDVLNAVVVYSDPDFAALEGYGSRWCVHADHAYSNHPLSGSLAETTVRGVGAEIRLIGCDPDGAESRARAQGYDVLAGSLDKGHGMRECYLLDRGGYCWVTGVLSRR